MKTEKKFGEAGSSNYRLVGRIIHWTKSQDVFTLKEKQVEWPFKTTQILSPDHLSDKLNDCSFNSYFNEQLFYREYLKTSVPWLVIPKTVGFRSAKVIPPVHQQTQAQNWHAVFINKLSSAWSVFEQSSATESNCAQWGEGWQGDFPVHLNGIHTYACNYIVSWDLTQSVKLRRDKTIWCCDLRVISVSPKLVWTSWCQYIMSAIPSFKSHLQLHSLRKY